MIRPASTPCSSSGVESAKTTSANFCRSSSQRGNRGAERTPLLHSLEGAPQAAASFEPAATDGNDREQPECLDGMPAIAHVTRHDELRATVFLRFVDTAELEVERCKRAQHVCFPPLESGFTSERKRVADHREATLDVAFSIFDGAQCPACHRFLDAEPDLP